MVKDWRLHAACRGLDPELFFPEQGGTHAQARAVCATCPVAAQCLEYALTESIAHGIWGGKSEKERRRMKRLRRSA